MLNSIALLGRLTKDPELRFTRSGKAVCNFTIAVDRDFKREGDKTADFFSVIAWEGLGENIAKYLTKGSQVCVLGSLRTRDWTDKEGQKRTAFEIVAQNADFVGERKKEPQRPEPEYPGIPSFEEIDDSDGELPY